MQNITTYNQNVTIFNPNIIVTATPTLFPLYNYIFSGNTITTSNYIDPLYYYINSGYDYYGIINIQNIENIINSIPIVENKIIPKGSTDTITYDDINNNDILIDFKRDTKTEYEYGVYYKESNLKSLLESNKNPFTMNKLDINSIVKFKALVL